MVEGQPATNRHYRHRPILFIAIAFAAGIVVDRLAEPPPAAAAGLIVVAVAAGLLLRRRRGLAGASLLLLAAAVGAVGHFAQVRHLPADHISRFIQDKPGLIRLQGTVSEPPAFADRREDRTARRNLSFLLDNLVLIPDQDKPRPVGGKIRVTIDGAKKDPTGRLSDLQYGSRLEIFGRIRAICGPRNPGQTDFGAYYRGIGVYGEFAFIAPGRVQPLDESGGHALFRIAAQIKERLNETLFYRAGQRGFLKDQQARLLSALTLGDRSGVAMEAFQETGTVHFLAISGLHLAILSSLFFGLLRLCRVGRRTTAALVIPVVITYAMMTGLRPPVVRAAIMISLLLIAYLVNRPRETLNVLALAALLILVVDPGALFLLGFQLSFIAVLSMAAFHGPLEQLWSSAFPADGFGRVRGSTVGRFLAGYIHRSTLLSISVWIGLFPILAYAFHLCTPLTVVANILLFPIVAAILILSVLLFVLGGLLGVHLSSPALVLGWLLDAMRAVVSLLSMNGSSDIRIVGFTPILVLAYYLLLLGWINRERLHLRWWPIGAGFAVVLLIVVARHWTPVSVSVPEVRLLDNGAGAVVVIQTPNGKTILIDAAGSKGTAKYLIEPYLDSRRIRTLDALLVSAEGAEPEATQRLIGNYTVRQLWVRGDSGPSEKDGPTEILLADPPIIRVTVGGRTLLVCADLTEADVDRLLEKEPKLRANLILYTGTHRRATARRLEAATQAEQALSARRLRRGPITIRLGDTIEVSHARGTPPD